LKVALPSFQMAGLFFGGAICVLWLPGKAQLAGDRSHGLDEEGSLGQRSACTSSGNDVGGTV
jgi:hypothetical protein